nr:f box:WD repeat containing protein 7 [Hymenolepis microstoma]
MEHQVTTSSEVQLKLDFKDDTPLVAPLILKIYNHSNPETILKFAEVSKTWRNVAMCDSAWEELCKDMGLSEDFSYNPYQYSRSKKHFEYCDYRPRWKDVCLQRIQLNHSWASKSDFETRKLKLNDIFKSNSELTCIKTFGEWILCGVKWNKIMVYDCSCRGRLIGVLVGPPGIAKKFLVVPLNGRVLLVAMTNFNEIYVYDLRGNRFLLHTKLIGHTGIIVDIAISTLTKDPLNPDSRGELLSSAEDKTIRLWNIESGCCIHVFSDLESTAISIALCGNHLVSMGADKYLRAWDAITYKPVLNELLTIENATIKQFDGAKVLFSRDDDIFVFDIFENTYDNFFTGSVPFCLLPHQLHIKTWSDLIYMKGENIVCYNLCKNKIANTIPAGEHCKADEIRAIHANSNFIVTVDNHRVQLWDRKARSWVRTLLDIEQMPEVKEFCKESEGGAVVTTESFRHLAVPVKLKNNEIALLVLVFD